MVYKSVNFNRGGFWFLFCKYVSKISRMLRDNGFLSKFVLKKKMNHLTKSIIYLFVVIMALFVGFFMLVIVAFSGEEKFYVPYILIGGALFLILLFLQMFRLKKNKKRMRTIWIIFIVVMVTSCAVYEGKNAYDRSIPRVREGNVDLSLYEPFGEGTKAVDLGEPSTLKMEDDLPLLDGATALYPLYAAFARAVYPAKEYIYYNSEVACRNTIRAYQLLIDQKVDIIFAAPPSEDQIKRAREAGIAFNYTPIGKEAFVFFVNAHNPVESLTAEQIQKIYSGKITSWKEIGGKDEPIRPFQRNENSGSQTAFQYFMKGHTIMKPEREDVVGGMGGIISQTADYVNYSNAIGFSFRYYALSMVGNSGIRLLKVNNIAPELETIGNGTYPLSSSFYAITLADNAKPNVAKLLEWLLSEQGQELVEKTGYCRVN